MRLLSVEGAEEELEEKALGGSVGSTVGAGTTKADGGDRPDDAGCRRNGYVHVSGSFRMMQCRHGGPCSSHWFRVLLAQHRFANSPIWRGSEPPAFTLTWRFLQLWHPFRDLVWDFLLSMDADCTRWRSDNCSRLCCHNGLCGSLQKKIVGDPTADRS